MQVPAAVTKALQELDSPPDDASNEALRLPVSVGERREDTDHTGAPSYVVDAIFNADVVSQEGAGQENRVCHLQRRCGERPRSRPNKLSVTCVEGHRQPRRRVACYLQCGHGAV